MASLKSILDDVDVRVGAIRASQPDWLCAKGCDGCCHRLATIPGLTKAEWDLLRQGLEQKSAAELAGLGRAMEELRSRNPTPVVCPLLDQNSGACTVYPWRPVACRTYGFYVQRDKGLYCEAIQAKVAAGELEEVVWGNQDRVDRDLASCGPVRPLTDWFLDWQRSR